MQSPQYIQVPQYYGNNNQQPCVVIPMNSLPQQQMIPANMEKKKASWSFDMWMLVLGFLFIIPWLIEFRHVFSQDMNKRIFATRSLCGMLFYAFLVVFIILIC